jgi:hypothetical protein
LGFLVAFGFALAAGAWAIPFSSVIVVVIVMVSFGRDLRGHDMNHSGRPTKQVNSDGKPPEAMERRCTPTGGSEGQQMAGSTAKLGRKQEEAILALLSQRSIEEAARVAGIGPRTLYRWTKEPEFDAAYREARRTAFRQSVARLQQASGAAVSTLLKTMVDPATPPATKVRAADSVLGHSAKAIELEDIEARVAELERATESSKDGRR